MVAGDPESAGTLTLLGLALCKLSQELLVLLLQAGQEAAQGSLPVLGLPQPLLRVLGDGDSGVRAIPEDGDTWVRAVPRGMGTARSEPSQWGQDSRVRAVPRG